MSIDSKWDPKEASQKVYEWLRQPDWSGDEFDFVAWANSRPIADALKLQELHAMLVAKYPIIGLALASAPTSERAP